MSNLHRPEDVAAYNENALEELAWAIEASVEQFKLFLARCNYTSLRLQMVEQLRELMSIEIRILELNESEKTLYAKIHAELGEEQPDPLMVFGLESVGDLDQLLSATNQVREEFRKNFHFPVVLWVTDEVLKKLLQLAPDFESWATTTDFRLTTNELVDFLKETAERFFEGNLTLTLEAGQEIKQGCQDLQSREPLLDLELKASIESLLGFTESVNYVNRNLDTALEHYQKGLELWQQISNLERQGQLLSDIAFCYYLKALRHRKIDHPDWQETRHYLRQSLEIFEQAQRPDLVANSILSLGIVLRRLQDWQRLQTLAQKALQLHETENKPIELAQDYGFLAEVALAKKRWSEAKEFAQKALDVLSAVPSLQSANSSGAVYKLPDKSVISYAPSRYRFILGQAQQYLDQPQEAIRNLEAAKRVGSPEHDTKLYLDILCDLQKLYFEQKEYLKAFEIKLERQSIEQQYGFRAFVGAGRIQPQRQAKFALTQVKTQETIAPEITASGRQLDVERLMKRIGRNDCKLLVIHGESGVGKSSLVYGGLVPALKQKVIGTSDFLPVPMRVYTSWVGELGKLLAEALLEKGIHLSTPLDSEAAILEQLQRSESLNLRTVLIFDQFEEFFFVYPTPGEKQRFFEFLGACLNILPVKVILSLRKDYLHYLLECNRLPSMKIIGNDILTKNVLYELGNFSPADATAIVERLTEVSNFHLETALIEQLVRDLAGNLGEVRPIELQIVGAQLQTDNITTLVEYQHYRLKEKLVEKLIEEVVKDCGSENEQAAQLVLYFLTDANNTRPLKTSPELAKDLDTADLASEVDKLELVLQILVGSGFVLKSPGIPSEHYQLVHDYLVSFIRQSQQAREVEKRKKDKEERNLIEAKLNQVLKQRLQLASTLTVFLLGLTVLAIAFSFKTWMQAKQRSINAQVNDITLNSKTFHSLNISNQRFDALIKSLKLANKENSAAQIWVLTTLVQAAYTVEDLAAKKHNGLTVHTDSVIVASLSPDGKTIASGSEDGTVKLWSMEGSLLKSFIGHSNSVTAISFSPDGNTIVSASWDGTVKLWSLNDTLPKTLFVDIPVVIADIPAVIAVSFSPDGKTIVAGTEKGTVKLWRLDGTLLKSFTTGQYVTVVSFSPDGKTIAIRSREGIKLWNTEGKLLKTLTSDSLLSSHTAAVLAVSFSPDGKTIVAGTEEGTVKLWSLSGSLLKSFTTNSDRVTAVSFSPDGKTIVAGTEKGTVKLWSLSGILLKTLTW